MGPVKYGVLIFAECSLEPAFPLRAIVARVGRDALLLYRFAL